MTTLEQICQNIDDNPKDLYLWSILGDWLEENNDPRNSGIRWLIAEGKYPEYYPKHGSPWVWWDGDWLRASGLSWIAGIHFLPSKVFEWFMVIHLYADFPTLSSAILAAAESYSKVNREPNTMANLPTHTLG